MTKPTVHPGPHTSDVAALRHELAMMRDRIATLEGEVRELRYGAERRER